MFELSSRAQDFVQRTRKFIETEIEPVEKVFWEEVHQLNPDGNWKSWQWPEQLTVLKEKLRLLACGICFYQMLSLVQGFLYRSMLI